jgi:sulfur carrier protein ThiS
MPRVKVILHPGAIINSGSRRIERTVVVNEGTTVNDLQFLLHASPGTVVSVVEGRVMKETDVIRHDMVLEFYPVFAGG